jgi:hypothetical protein
MLRRTFGPTREILAGIWDKLRNEELHDVHLPPDIVRLTKSWSLLAVGQAIGKGQVKNCRKGLLAK